MPEHVNELCHPSMSHVTHKKKLLAPPVANRKESHVKNENENESGKLVAPPLWRGGVAFRRRPCSLQHAATRCNTLQNSTTHCNTLQHTAIHCSTL